MKSAIALFFLMIFPVLYLYGPAAQPHYQITGVILDWALKTCEHRQGMRRLAITPMQEVVLYCRDGSRHKYSEEKGANISQ